MIKKTTHFPAWRMCGFFMDETVLHDCIDQNGLQIDYIPAVHILQLIAHDFPHDLVGPDLSAVSGEKDRVTLLQDLRSLVDLAYILIRVDAISFHHVKAADDIVRISPIQFPEVIQDVEDAVVCTAGEKR